MATKQVGINLVGRIYHYAFRVNGRRYHGSTKATDLQTARRVLEERRREAILGLRTNSRGVPTLQELLSEWLRAHNAAFSDRHLKNTESCLRVWVLPVMGNLPVSKVALLQVLKVRTRQLEAGKSGNYANNTLKALKAVLNFGVSLGYLDKLPFKIQKLKVQQKPRPVIPPTRVQDFFLLIDQRTRNPHVGILVRVAVALGLRESEALTLRWEHFDLEQRTYTVWKTKNGRTRVLPVPDWLWDYIMQAPKTLNEWVCPAKDGLPHRTQYLAKALRRVSTALELGNITSHRLRATTATLLADLNTPLTVIQRGLGHADPNVTAGYIEQGLEAQRIAQRAMSMRLGLA